MGNFEPYYVVISPAAMLAIGAIVFWLDHQAARLNDVLVRLSRPAQQQRVVEQRRDTSSDPLPCLDDVLVRRVGAIMPRSPLVVACGRLPAAGAARRRCRHQATSRVAMIATWLPEQDLAEADRQR
jgi:hypothetical protein